MQAASFFTVIAFFLMNAGQAFACTPGQEIWAYNDPSGIKTVVYEPGAGSSNPVIFEGWNGQQILWRVEGYKACSNGVVMCGVSIPLSDGNFLNTEIDSIYEGESPQYLVFSQLQQLSYRTQNYGDEPQIVSSWLGPEPDDGNFPQLVLPTAYKFVGCQKGDERKAGTLDDETGWSTEQADEIRKPEYKFSLTEETAPSSVTLPICLSTAGCGSPDAKIQIELNPSEKAADIRIVTDRDSNLSASMHIEDIGPGDIELHLNEFDRGNETKELLVNYYTGGAHCCMRNLVFSVRNGSMRVIEVADVDGDPIVKRRAETGIFVFGDQRFLYTFGPYAISDMPLQIFELYAGEFLEITRQERFRPLHQPVFERQKKRCKEKDGNPSCAALLATSIFLEVEDETWDFILEHSRPQLDEGAKFPEFCKINLGLDAECPKDEVIKLEDFPSALSEALSQWDYW